MNQLTKIEIWWHGPLTMDDIKKDFGDTNNAYGLYQIYGTHNISGPNTLLYIGKASEQTFATRLKQHNWTNWEASATQFYVGRLGGPDKIDEDTWGQLIDKAEQLLIYYCAPPYNTQHLNGYGNIKDTIVLNYDKKNRLPIEVSTFYSDSEFWDDKETWKEFAIEDD